MSQILLRLQQAEHYAFFLDYDGTLAPIAAQPEQAVLPGEARAILQDLGRCPLASVAILSGRTIPDLSARVGLPLIYAGNHGLEIEGPGWSWRHPEVAPAAAALPGLLKSVVIPVPGVRIESKLLSASVHFRNAEQGAESEVRAAVERALAPYASLFTLRDGKKVIEIRPRVDWNKGKAAQYLLSLLPNGALPVCFGDDVTDEDMILALRTGITVHVGETPSAAEYHLPDVPAAIALLGLMRDAVFDRSIAYPGQTRR